MRQFLLALLLIIGGRSVVLAQNANNTNPAVGTPLTSCFEGRTVRIVNGIPSCAGTSPPTLTGCGSSTIDATATDFIGQISIPASVTSCTLVMSKLYTITPITCFLGNQKPSVTLALGTPTIGNNGTNSTVQFPITLNLSSGIVGYICGPG